MKVEELVKELREANDPLLECKPFRWESLSHAADWLEALADVVAANRLLASYGGECKCGPDRSEDNLCGGCRRLRVWNKALARLAELEGK